MDDLVAQFWSEWQDFCCRYVHPLADGWPSLGLLISAASLFLALVVRLLKAAC